MATLLPYGENTAYYKRSIADINAKVNLPNYLAQQGYRLMAKSAGSMEFRKANERIVVQTRRQPMTYFNRHDPNDKGRFFTFIRHRCTTFYTAFECAMRLSQQPQPTPDAVYQPLRSKKNKTPLASRYRITPLTKMTYLTQDRGISESTLTARPFQNRLFNALYTGKNGGTIANIAFPKYDLKGNVKNYILYNKPYRHPLKGTYQTFRLVLHAEDHYLFQSRPPEGKNLQIVFGESGIDLLSYYELQGKPDQLYVSFGGQVYGRKLECFMQLYQTWAAQKKVQLVSIMDNDAQGYLFDLHILTAFIHNQHPHLHITTLGNKEKLQVQVQYDPNYRETLAMDYVQLEKGFANPSTPIRCIGFLDKIVLEFPHKKSKPAQEQPRTPIPLHFVVEQLAAVYLDLPFALHKSQGKDWNEDLLRSKEKAYVLQPFLHREQLAVGDQVTLTTAKGPERTKPIGIIITKNDTSVTCDFGLRRPYAIPYSQIKAFGKRQHPDPATNQKSQPKTSNTKSDLKPSHL